MTSREILEEALVERQQAAQAARLSHEEVFSRAIDSVESSSAQFQTVADLFRMMEEVDREKKQ